MRCPVCLSSSYLGILQRYHRGGRQFSRYFCRNCCTEISCLGNQVTAILSINEDGEAVQRIGRPFRHAAGL